MVTAEERETNTRVLLDGEVKFVVAHNDDHVYYKDEENNEDRSKNFGCLSAINQVGFEYDGITIHAIGRKVEPVGNVYGGPVIM